jgi:hypothetical protein
VSSSCFELLLASFIQLECRPAASSAATGESWVHERVLEQIGDERRLSLRINLKPILRIRCGCANGGTLQQRFSQAHGHRAAGGRFNHSSRLLVRFTCQPSSQIVSWLCDPFWKEVFGKSIQKLRTNSRNLYEIEDSSFRMLYVWQLLRPLHFPVKYCNACFSFYLQSPKLSVIICGPTRRTKMLWQRECCSVHVWPAPAARHACPRSYLHMPCGLLRGALHSFGILARCHTIIHLLHRQPSSLTLACRC